MGRYDGYYGDFKPYVSVAQRKVNAAREVAKLEKKGRTTCPVHIEGRAIAKTFWGKAWCDNLEAYSDFSNRLPRGRTYVRNGSVVDLQIIEGKIGALVSGTSLYTVDISVVPLEKARWGALSKECAGQIDSLVELLQGKLSKPVMEVLCRKNTGMFPAPREIKFKCSCPDFASMCKHVAAVLYGVGNRLDHSPDLLFLLRGVETKDLLVEASVRSTLGRGEPSSQKKRLAEGALSGLFGIDLDEEEASSAQAREPAPPSPLRGRAQKNPPAPTPAPAPPKAQKPAPAKEARTPSPPPERKKPAAVPPPAPAKKPAILKASTSARKKVTARELAALGIPHSTIQSWLGSGVLVHSGERGVYKTTATTTEKIAQYVARIKR